jgi:hypothetical protein
MMIMNLKKKLSRGCEFLSEVVPSSVFFLDLRMNLQCLKLRQHNRCECTGQSVIFVVCLIFQILCSVLYQYFINTKNEQGLQQSTSVFDRITFQISLPWTPSKFLLFPKKSIVTLSNAWVDSKAFLVFKNENLCTEL